MDDQTLILKKTKHIVRMDGALPDQAASGAMEAEAAAGVKWWTKYNTDAKKASLQVKRARHHEADIEKLLKKCHRQYVDGLFAEHGVRPGRPLGLPVQEGAEALMYSPDEAAWVPVRVIRIVKTRKLGHPDMVAATKFQGGACIVAPFPCVRTVTHDAA